MNRQDIALLLSIIAVVLCCGASLYLSINGMRRQLEREIDETANQLENCRIAERTEREYADYIFKAWGKCEESK